MSLRDHRRLNMGPQRLPVQWCTGRCHTGDCGGLLECKDYGAAPNTLAEFALNQFSGLDYIDISLVDGFNVLRFSGLDYIDISLVDGFNVPVMLSSASPASCGTVMRCRGDIIRQERPNALRVDGGCNGACPQLKRDEYCCPNRYKGVHCGPTDFSRYFKDGCYDAYSCPAVDPTSVIFLLDRY